MTSKAAKTMNAFRNMVPLECTVIREGVRKNIPATALVVGDVCIISGGEKVPADMRMLSASSLKVENAALTGESEPISLDPNNIPFLDSKIEECKNLAFNSSLIQEGDGIGVVIATGDNTLIGRIASLTVGVAVRRSTMEIEVAHFVKFFSILAMSMAALLFVIAVGRKQGQDVLNLFINGFLVLIVANVPQGLPATITSLQLIVAQRLATMNVFVKRLDAVETLGAATVIASDKTGTLTMGKMTVVDGWVNMTVGTHVITECLFSSPHRRSLFNMANDDESTQALLIAGGGSTEVVASERGTSAKQLRRSNDDGRAFSNASSAVSALQITACICNNAITDNEAQHGAIRSSLEGLRISAKLTEHTGKASPRKNRGFSSVVDDRKPPSSFRGNPSEAALANFFENFKGGVVEELREMFPVVFQINFNSRNKYMASVVRGSLNGVTVSPTHYTVLMKGAPEVISRRCTQYIKDGVALAVDEDFHQQQHEAYRYFAKRGMRVLGFCIKEFQGPANTNEFSAEADNVPLEQMLFVGMLAIQDPPRDDVPAAVAKCHSAGVKVFMVTGDHPITAAAIAGQIGLIPEGAEVVDYAAGMWSREGASVTDGFSLVIHGIEIDKFTGDDWAYVLSHSSLVFARTTPQNKLTICEHLQQRDEIVCVTGDGVNDAPALKRANIGAAMGLNGSEVAREAADVILTDDNFASIVLGVEQGRLLYDNLKKTIAYTLAHLAGEILPIILTLLFGFPSLLSSLQILSIDLLTELAPAISLAYETPEKDIMGQKPRNVKVDRLVSGPVLLYSYIIAGTVFTAVACFLAALSVFWWYGLSASQLFLSDGLYFVPGKPFIIVPNFGFLCGTSSCYSPDEQVSISQQASGAYYIVLICSQFFHIWMCKTRRASFFQHGIKNMTMNYGVCIEIGIMIMVVAIPGLNTAVFGTQLPPGVAVLPMLWSWAGLWIYNEGRKAFVRRHRKEKNFVKRWLMW